MRHNKFSRAYFLLLILLSCVAAGERPTSAQGGSGKGAGGCGDGPLPRSIQMSPRPPAGVMGGLHPSTLLRTINRPQTQVPAAPLNQRARRDTPVTLRIDTAGGELYNLSDMNGRIFYRGDSDRDISQTLNGMIGQDRSAVSLTVNGLNNERDAAITSLSIWQQQINPRVYVKRESFLGSALDTGTETITLSPPSSGEKLRAYITAVPVRLLEYREQRRTNRIIKRGIKRLARTHPAASKAKFRKEAGRTRVVSIPRTRRAAELWTTA